ncbi:unnamed protein product [Symbiodinium pilosum]|uniref:Uncharacterized protein n=1 Tax=Symbiodinium pilosum TaxID=2952 RepID=A0A812IQA4_SYMPI|nr:unnamed protein product [Symbiodinium pilosum]
MRVAGLRPAPPPGRFYMAQVRTVGADGWESPPGQAGWSAPLICEDLNSLDPNELREREGPYLNPGLGPGPQPGLSASAAPWEPKDAWKGPELLSTSEPAKDYGYGWGGLPPPPSNPPRLGSAAIDDSANEECLILDCILETDRAQQCRARCIMNPPDKSTFTRSSKDPLAAVVEKEKREKEKEEKNKAEKLPERAVQKGEARVWHILKKHRDFFGKPAKSWRQTQITWSKKEAKESLKALKYKLENVAYGGGAQALQKKFENYARAESDDDVRMGVTCCCVLGLKKFA